MCTTNNAGHSVLQRVRSVGNLEKLPAGFKEHVWKAKAWQTLSEQQKKLVEGCSSTPLLKYRDPAWPRGIYVDMSILNADLITMSAFLEPRAYTLCMLDLPRGLELDPVSKQFDTRFTQEEFAGIVTQFAKVTTVEVYRFCVFHSPDDVSMVRSVLFAACKSPVVTCTWQKTNIVSGGNDRVYDALDFITIAAAAKEDDYTPTTFAVDGVSVSQATECTNVFRERPVELK